MSDDNETLLEFPCRFSVKAFGASDAGFEQTVYTLVKAHVPELTAADLSSRASSRRNYISVTATFTAKSKAQIDAIYRDLTASDQVVLSL
jgi:putative lipoic acid-binding regulatory protein